MIRIDVESTMGFEFDERDVNHALRRVSPEIIEMLRGGTPKRTTKLATGWEIKRIRYGIAEFVTHFYGNFVDKGTRPHVIRARRAKALAVGGGRYKSVQHPGARASNFIERLQSAGADRIGSALVAEIRKRVMKS